MIKTLCKVFLLSAALLSAHAASWYVSTASAGSANGTSWANCWATNGIVWSTGGVIPGDTLYIDGGSTGKVYTAAFNAGVNGTSWGAALTLSVGQDAGHNGPVIYDGNDDINRMFSPSTGMFVNGANFSIVTGLVGTNQNLWVINTRTSNSDREAGIACFAGVPSNQIWEGITISNANNGMSWNGASCTGIVARSITMRYVRGDYCFRFSGSSSTGSFTNGVFHNNSLLMSADFVGGNGGPDGLGGGGGITFHDNEVTWTNGTVVLGQHPDGVQMLASWNKVYNNRFHNPLNSGVKFEPTSPTTYFSDCYAWNNVVDVNDPVYAANTNYNGKGFEFGGGASVTGVTNLVCVHNTVVDLLGLIMNGGQGTWSTVPGQWILENNLGYNCGRNTPTNGWATGNSNIVMDFNGGVKGAHGWTNILIDLPGNGVFTTYYQTNTPAQFSFTGYSEYAATNTLTITANVTGANLGRFASLTALDATGATRDTNNPTIGAFEWTSTPQSGGGGTTVYARPPRGRRR